MPTPEQVIEQVFTSVNPTTGSQPPPAIAWVVFAHGTVFFTVPTDAVPVDATLAALADAGRAALKELGPVHVATPSAESLETQYGMPSPVREHAMTLEDVVNRSAILFIVLLATAVPTFFFAPPALLGPIWIGGIILTPELKTDVAWIPWFQLALAACLIHAIVPGWFTETAGRTVMGMYDHMTKRRAVATNPNDWPEYEI